MRLRVLIPLAIAISGCSVAPASHAAEAKEAMPSVLSACANPALPSLIATNVDADPAHEPSPEPTLAIAKIVAPEATLSLAVAKDDTARELGLMCVLHLEPHVGMIFVFDRDSKQEFWMKNTLIALDMVWVRSTGVVDTVAANVPKSTRATPDDAVARRAGTGKYVIELAAGEAAADGIVAGSALKLAPSP